ncbi:MAG: hypothetical protein EP348_07080 [Alphaproteobacteria bacterium]|nr:MAG: hypothetical protein EP348_07080 [Alphaproteobacteria bacterium]
MDRRMVMARKKMLAYKWRHLLLVPALAAGLMAVPSRSQADVLGDLFSVFEPSDDQNTGAAQHPKILTKFGGEYKQVGLNEYILDIGLRLAAVSSMKTLPWHFTVLNTPVINAFALPGGYVYITRGLLALANNEAEVAGVLAHEIGHVTARHGAARQSRATGIGLLGALAGILTGSEAVQQIGQQLGGLYVASYSREQEYEADQLGVKYLGLAGYPREAMADFLKRLQAQSDYAAKASGNGGGSQFDFFASHPQTEDRVARAEDAAQKAHDDLDRDYDRKRYLSHIDKMLYGDDPKEGIIKGREFLHPVLKFKFTAPEEFQLINSTEAVYGQDRNGNVMVFDLGKKERGVAPASYLKNVWLTKLKPTKVQTFDVYGASAAGTGVTVDQNGGRIYLSAAVVEFTDGQVARFMFQTKSMTSALQQKITASVKSFQPISKDEAGDVRPLEIQIKAVKAGETTEGLAKSMAGEAPDKKALLLLLNPELEGKPPVKGEEYKILRYGEAS